MHSVKLGEYLQRPLSWLLLRKSCGSMATSMDLSYSSWHQLPGHLLWTGEPPIQICALVNRIWPVTPDSETMEAHLWENGHMLSKAYSLWRQNSEGRGRRTATRYLQTCLVYLWRPPLKNSCYNSSKNLKQQNVTKKKGTSWERCCSCQETEEADAGGLQLKVCLGNLEKERKQRNRGLWAQR